MKIILAPDSFKGSLTSLEVAGAMEAGIKRALPEAECIRVPMADGGEGTVQSLLDAVGGELIPCSVKGPAGQKVAATYGLLADGRTAVIEMAAASGLALVHGSGKNPLKTTSYGTGELIRDALDRGVRQIILGIGGSATNDGGTGMAQALGVVFRDGEGRVIRESGAGGMLHKIESVDLSCVHSGLQQAHIRVACDVDNSLTGETGAARVFAPQKGADAEMVQTLDSNLKHLAGVIARELGVDVDPIPGAGAAGGMGAGLLVFAGAELNRGIDIISRATSIETHLRSADLVLTGEGRVDVQTAFGKTPAGIARLAGEYGVPVVAIGGGLADDAGEVFRHGIGGLEPAIARDMTLDEALANSGEYIANAAERVIRLIGIGRGMKTMRG
jgi:glycerate kinase